MLQASKHEYNGGVSWSDVRLNARGEGILTSFIFLILDIFIYGFLAFYFDNVLPSKFSSLTDFAKKTTTLISSSTLILLQMNLECENIRCFSFNRVTGQALRASVTKYVSLAE